MKVWLLVLLVQVSPNSALPVYKNFSTEEECKEEIVTISEVAFLEGINLDSRCEPYDGFNAEAKVISMIESILVERENK